LKEWLGSGEGMGWERCGWGSWGGNGREEGVQRKGSMEGDGERI